MGSLTCGIKSSAFSFECRVYIDEKQHGAAAVSLLWLGGDPLQLLGSQVRARLVSGVVAAADRFARLRLVLKSRPLRALLWSPLQLWKWTDETLETDWYTTVLTQRNKKDPGTIWRDEAFESFSNGRMTESIFKISNQWTRPYINLQGATEQAVFKSWLRTSSYDTSISHLSWYQLNLCFMFNLRMFCLI